MAGDSRVERAQLETHTGAGKGALTGFSVGGPIGAAVGAGIGAAPGAINQWQARRAAGESGFGATARTALDLGNPVSVLKGVGGMFGFGGGGGDRIDYDPTGLRVVGGRQQGASYDMRNYDQNRAMIAGEQQNQGRLTGMGKLLQARAMGHGPSAAELQMQAGLGQATAQARAGTAGVTNPALAKRLAARQGSQMAMQTNQQAGILRAQEQAQAQAAAIREEQERASRVQHLMGMGLSLDQAQTQSQIQYQRDAQQRAQFIASLQNQQAMAEAGYDVQESGARAAQTGAMIQAGANAYSAYKGGGGGGG